MRIPFIIHVSENINNFLHLAGAVFQDGGNEYEIHLRDRSACLIIGNEPRNSAHLYLVHQPLNDVPPHMQLVLPRFTKPIQAVILERMYKRFKAEGHGSRIKSLWTYAGAIQGSVVARSYPAVLPPERKFVIRPQEGARSLGQVVFSSKDHSISSIMELIFNRQEPQEQHRSELPRTTDSNVGDKDTIDPDKVKDIPDVNQAVINAVSCLKKPENFFERTEYPKGVEVFIGNGDTAEAWSQFSQSHFIQEMASVRAEYRIICDHEGIALALKRPRGKERKSGEYEAVVCEKDEIVYNRYTATTFACAMLGIGSPMNRKAKMLIEMYEDIERFIQQNIDVFKLNSMDLFITKDNEWGFFEFCNQFTTDDMGSCVGTQVMQRIMINKIKDDHLHE